MPYMPLSTPLFTAINS